ncbi:MAG TPA: ribosomal-protein-alanine N-acetyltransferase [Myxococcales bacterium]|nr:ribosomal-protein-alanine N-acetyltransferase [Deltaproteobacteria bacterium]MBU49854.1 ribosomal-protein-alanine N-acetyltransferase [Deltaproteobacteria bacterium]HAA56748.1 ribosomal-protein-alanine N-acetyltransferase [Myxococcales bacterium]|tara:strand:- start:40533 stop:41009 length:477 start_codon:yes stop_codon:yes gene_type:complete
MCYSVASVQPPQLPSVYPIAQAAFPDWSFKAFSEEAQRPRYTMRMAMRCVSGEREVLGFSLLWSAPDEVHILNIASAPVWRRKGIGQVLLEDALSLARREGALQMILEVRASNTPAIALYTKAGFLEIGRRKRYYRAPVEDAIVFAREIEHVGQVVER